MTRSLRPRQDVKMSRQALRLHLRIPRALVRWLSVLIVALLLRSVRQSPYPQLSTQSDGVPWGNNEPHLPPSPDWRGVTNTELCADWLMRLDAAILHQKHSRMEIQR